MSEAVRTIDTVQVDVCSLCGSEGSPLHERLRDTLFSVPGVWTLLLCPRCGLVWLSPRPTDREIPRLYERYHTHGATKEVNPVTVGWAARQAALRRLGYDVGSAARGWRRLVGAALARLGPVRDAAAGSVLWNDATRRGRLLDVGCGSGRFLAEMRGLGWNVEGVESDPAAARIARATYGLDITSSSLEEAALPAERFDVVTANHVIEHVPDPVSFLVECRRLLRPDGRLIVVTPNSRSLGGRWFGRRWRGWEPPRHLFIFSPSTLRIAGLRAGLHVDRVRTTARAAREIWQGSERGAEGPKSRRRMTSAVLFWLLEHAVTTAMPVGEEAVLLARRMP